MRVRLYRFLRQRPEMWYSVEVIQMLRPFEGYHENSIRTVLTNWSDGAYLRRKGNFWWWERSCREPQFLKRGELHATR